MNFKDYYRALGILPTAEDAVVKGAYRALAARYHPDVWRGDRLIAEARMRELNEAYSILSDTEKRRRYDEERGHRGFDAFDFESSGARSDFEAAEKEQSEPWSVAVDYYPDLDGIVGELRRTSIRLAFSFRAAILETKQFSSRHALAQQMEIEFLQSYFGRNKKVLEFAKSLIRSGYRDAARELNRAVSVLGDKNDPAVIIDAIVRKYALTTASKAHDDSKKDFRSTQRIASELTENRYVSDAEALIKKMNGSIAYKNFKSFPWSFQASTIVVDVCGQSKEFLSQVEMVNWTINFLVPIALTEKS